MFVNPSKQLSAKDLGGKKVLDLGCGPMRREGAFRVDVIDEYEPDLVWDLRKLPYPLPDNSFDEVYLENVLEHLPDTVGVVKEVHRICKPGALVKIWVPHYTGYTSWSCPEHYKTFTSISFDYFCDHGYFEMVDKKLRYSVHKKHRILDWLINRNFVVADRFGSLIGGIAEVHVAMRAKPKSDAKIDLRGHLAELPESGKQY